MSSEKSSEAPEKPSKRASEEGRLEPGPTAKAPRQEMTAELGGLTETLTLKILSELDFQSLGAVERVCRRLRRVARDKRLFDRISIVKWNGPKCKYTHDEYKGELRTDCAELGHIQMPMDGKEAAAKFLVILERLLEGGAQLVSLETPSCEQREKDETKDGGVLHSLPALLDKHSVRLKGLGCSHRVGGGLVELAKSQPELKHLRLATFPDEMDGMMEVLPALRHLDVHNPFTGEEDVERLGGLLQQIRSAVFGEGEGFFVFDAFKHVPEASGGQLVFRSVGYVPSHYDGDDYDFANGCSDFAYAVEDFRREERGRRFLGAHGHEAWDQWDGAQRFAPDEVLTDPYDVSAFISSCSDAVCD